MRCVLKSKLHRLVVTGANLDYEGSITIDKQLLLEADILSYEQVHVLNLANGARIVTYAIESDTPGEVTINGAAAHVIHPGDLVIVLTYRLLPQTADLEPPRFIFVNEYNHLTAGPNIP